MPGDEGSESDEEQQVGRYAGDDSPAWARVGGLRMWVFSNSLGITMGLLGSWVAQAVAGRAAYNAQQLHQHQDPVGLGAYVASPDFWDRTLQNWQSEFLAILTMVVLSVHLRQRRRPSPSPWGRRTVRPRRRADRGGGLTAEEG